MAAAGLQTMELGRLEWGFFLFEGELFLARPWGRETLAQPVVDGKVSNQCDLGVTVFEKVDVIPKSLWKKYGIFTEMLKRV